MLNNRFIQQISVEETFPFKKFLLKEFPSDKLAVCHIGSVIGGTLDGGRNTKKENLNLCQERRICIFFLLEEGPSGKSQSPP